MQITDDFRRWMDQVVSCGKPGQRLPSDRQLAAQWGLSPMTIRRVLTDYAERDLVVRVKGKGSFLPGSTGGREDTESEIPDRNASESLETEIANAIGRGRMRIGEPLPSYRELCTTFRVSAQTVRAAYESLHRKGLITRTGKYYQVGDFMTILRQSRRKTIIVLYPDNTDLQSIYTVPETSPALAKMERELLVHGFSIEYRQYRSLHATAKAWEQGTGFYHGFILTGQTYGGIDEKQFELFEPALRRIVGYTRRAGPKTLAITANFIPPIPNCESFSVSHVTTEEQRTLARFLFRSGFSYISLFYDSGSDTPDKLVLWLRFIAEMRALNPQCELSIRIAFSIAFPSSEAFLNRFNTLFPEEKLHRLTNKWVEIDTDSVREMLKFGNTFESSMPTSRVPQAWVFMRDAQAVSAAAFCREQGIAVPDTVALISLENSRLHLQHGITTCTCDWDATGYLLAHALIGDVPIRHTRRGFLPAPALLLERSTTPRKRGTT